MLHIILHKDTGTYTALYTMYPYVLSHVPATTPHARVHRYAATLPPGTADEGMSGNACVYLWIPIVALCANPHSPRSR